MEFSVHGLINHQIKITIMVKQYCTVILHGSLGWGGI